jgi:prepilin-type N-terminal cleavage/methylation domain-containing protein
MRRKSQTGVTLLEVLVAVTLLSLLSLGMLLAMRLGLSAFVKTDDKLMQNRRVAGAQRVLEQEIEGLVPVAAPCTGGGPKFGFFQGQPNQMRLVSTFSLQEGWRGRPQILELFVAQGEEGLRLLVNESPYMGPAAAGQLCLGLSETGPQFAMAVATPKSFVLADKLAVCRFLYLVPPQDPQGTPVWQPVWTGKGWPLGVKVEMAPAEPSPARLQPIAVVAPLYIHRSPEIPYADF